MKYFLLCSIKELVKQVIQNMIKVKALGKDFHLKDDGDKQLVESAQVFQNIIDALELSTRDITRDQLLVLAGLEMAKKVHLQKENTLDQKSIEKWTAKLEQICDKIDSSIKEAVKSA